MYSISTRIWLVGALLLACRATPAVAVVVVPEGAPAVRPPATDGAGILEISTSGYSRFEIAEGAVVAFYTGGVEASYAGYLLRSESLRLNQETQQAELTGGVKLSGPAATLASPRVSLDLGAGKGWLGEGVKGALVLSRDDEPRQELQFASGSMELAFVDMGQPLSSANLTARLAGNVLLTAADGSRLSAPLAEYDGSTGTLAMTGGFVGEYLLPAGIVLGQPAQSPAPAANPGKLYISGSALLARLDEAGQVRAGEITAPVVTTTGAKFNAERAELLPRGPEETGYRIRLSGAPVSAAVDYNGVPLALSASELSLAAGQATGDVVTLSGSVLLRGAGLDGVAETIELRPAPGGSFALAFPRGLKVGGDLAELTQRSPIRLEELTQAR